MLTQFHLREKKLFSDVTVLLEKDQGNKMKQIQIFDIQRENLFSTSIINLCSLSTSTRNLSYLENKNEYNDDITYSNQNGSDFDFFKTGETLLILVKPNTNSHDISLTINRRQMGNRAAKRLIQSRYLQERIWEGFGKILNISGKGYEFLETVSESHNSVLVTSGELGVKWYLEDKMIPWFISHFSGNFTFVKEVALPIAIRLLPKVAGRFITPIATLYAVDGISKLIYPYIKKDSLNLRKSINNQTLNIPSRVEIKSTSRSPLHYKYFDKLYLPPYKNLTDNEAANIIRECHQQNNNFANRWKQTFKENLFDEEETNLVSENPKYPNNNVEKIVQYSISKQFYLSIGLGGDINIGSMFARKNNYS